MTNPHLNLLQTAFNELKAIPQKIVFVGGVTISLHIDDIAASPVRITKDVDFVVEITSYSDYAAFEKQLIAIGFQQSLLTETDPICRWQKGELIIDVLPTDPKILSFGSSKWFQDGFDNSIQCELPSGDIIEIFPSMYLMATKIDAFKNRGNDDWLYSQDASDIATLLDGRKSIFKELAANTEVAAYNRLWLSTHKNELVDVIASVVNTHARAMALINQIPDHDQT